MIKETPQLLTAQMQRLRVCHTQQTWKIMHLSFEQLLANITLFPPKHLEI